MLKTAQRMGNLRCGGEVVVLACVATDHTFPEAVNHADRSRSRAALAPIS